ncbi:MAG: SAM-dependent methyltransferase [Eubacteriales bacterium]|nr:SAM-dependent methyltransferase [Eubacteriales bacterium]
MRFTLDQIGTVHCGEEGFSIVIAPEYRAALTGLEGFGYVQILWWFDRCDNEEQRAVLTEEKPYVDGPDVMGVFATRSPQRPNPIAVSPAYVTYLDAENGVIGLAWIDALDGTPVLDVKPYTPSVDRVEQPAVPDWCAHWPKNVETSGDFDWDSVFNF